MIVMEQCTHDSYRDSTRMINTHYHRTGDDCLKVRTIADKVESVGNSIDRYIEDKTTGILCKSHFNTEDGLPLEEAQLPSSIASPDFSQEKDREADHYGEIRKAVTAINERNSTSFQIRRHPKVLAGEIEYSRDNCVYIAMDDVGVKHQKDARKDGGSKEGEVVENTDIRVMYQNSSYSITHVGMDEAFRRLTAFLLENHLMENKHLIFLTDGATNLRKAIECHYSYVHYTIIIDWFHLKKHCYETMSMAVRGDKHTKHAIQAEFNRRLWYGDIDAAIDYLEKMDEKDIKNKYQLQETIKYLKKKKPYAACYAVRSELGLPNSSSPVEKDNDLLVAQRQKNNGMSWSYDGSGCLAQITAVFRNCEAESWLTDRTIPFHMVSSAAPALFA